MNSKVIFNLRHQKNHFYFPIPSGVTRHMLTAGEFPQRKLETKPLLLCIRSIHHPSVHLSIRPSSRWCSRPWPAP